MVRALEARCRGAGGAARRPRRSGPGCGRASWYAAANATSVPSSASTDIAAATLAVRTSRSASARSSAPSAPISWVPLSSARPSFGLERRAARGRPRAAPSAPARPAPSTSTCAAADQRQREVGERRQVPGRPEAALLRHDRVDARVEEVASSRSTMSGRQPLWPSASVFARSSSIARTISRGNGAPDARRVAHRGGSPGAARRPRAAMNVVARSPNPVVTPYTTCALARRARSITSRASCIRPRACVVERDARRRAGRPPRRRRSCRSAPVRTTSRGRAVRRSGGTCGAVTIRG